MTTEGQIWTLIELGSTNSPMPELRALRDRLRRMFDADPESPGSTVWAWLLGLAEGSTGMDVHARMSRASVHLRRRSSKGAVDFDEPLSRRQQLRVFDREVKALVSELGLHDIDDDPEKSFGLRHLRDHHIIELTPRGFVRWHLVRREALVTGPVDYLIHEVHPGPTRIDHVDGIHSATLFEAQIYGQPVEPRRLLSSEPALLRVEPVSRPNPIGGYGRKIEYSFVLHYDESRPKFCKYFDIPPQGCLSIVIKPGNTAMGVVRFQEFDPHNLRTEYLSDVEVIDGAASYLAEAADVPLILAVSLHESSAELIRPRYFRPPTARRGS